MEKYTAFDLNRNVVDLEKKEIQLQVADNLFTPLTVKEAFRKALGAVFTDEQPDPQRGNPGITFEQKMKRYKISEKIYLCETMVELSIEEQAELKKCVGKLFNGEALGFLENVLERDHEPMATTNNGLDHSRTRSVQ